MFGDFEGFDREKMEVELRKILKSDQQHRFDSLKYLMEVIDFKDKTESPSFIYTPCFDMYAPYIAPMPEAKFDDPVYNVDAILSFESPHFKLRIQEKEEKKCDCGALKTYGKECRISFHSDWCSLK